MTRETKIGLLVGLAFIIVIGILLSDHWNSSNEPPQARVDGIGSNVRDGMGSPAAAAAQDPPVTSVAAVVQVPPPGHVRSQVQVQTPAELKPPITPAPVEQVSVGPAVPPRPVTGRVPIAPAPITSVQAAPPQVAEEPEPPFIAAVPDRAAGVSSALQELAAQHGQELVDAGAPDGGNVNRPAAQTAAAPGFKSYKVQSGDSLSRIAARLMGADTKANRDAIIRANASLRENPDLLIEGRTYNIPVGGAAAAAPVAQVRAHAPAPAAPQHRPSDWERLLPMEAVAESATGRAGRGQLLYTVKARDSLWRIAAEQLGNGNAWTQIRDLNKDVLKGGEAVREGMKLRLPARAVAAAG